MIDYKKILMKWFVDEVMEVRCVGDVDKIKVLFFDVFKFFENLCYGKMIENVVSYNLMWYMKDEKLVDRMLCSVYFEDLNEIGLVYEFIF